VAEGFAEAKGKYRGSIVDSFAVVPIGCFVAHNPDDEVRVAGSDASFSCAIRLLALLCCPAWPVGLPRSQAAHSGTTARTAGPQCVGGCTQRRSVISPVQTTSETSVGRWRNHTKAPRQLFHHSQTQPSGAATKRGNKKRTGMEMEGRLVVERRLWITTRHGRWLAPPARIHRWSISNVASKGRLRFACAPSRTETACKSPQELSRGGHARLYGRSTPPREASVRRNFP
jgi:hypothetical protein